MVGIRFLDAEAALSIGIEHATPEMRQDPHREHHAILRLTTSGRIPPSACTASRPARAIVRVVAAR